MRCVITLLLLIPFIGGEIPPECPTVVCECKKVGDHWMVDCQDKKLEQLPHFVRSYITWWVLDLSNNVIDKLISGDFQKFNVRELRLNGNGMNSIKQSALNNLRHTIKTLDLSDNDFSAPNAIEEGAFDDLTELATIHINNNVLKSLPNAPNLRMLTLDANNLKDFPEFVYKYSKLETLSLKANAIGELPNRVFEDLRELHEVDLTFNDIKSVNACVILPNKVRTLYLDYNPNLNCDCNLHWLNNANVKLSTNETGLNFLCPNTKFNCADGYQFCNLRPTDIPPRPSSSSENKNSLYTIFYSLGVFMYISIVSNLR